MQDTFETFKGINKIMILLVYEVIEKVAAAKKKADKINILKKNESWALKDILRGTFDSTVVWNLPEGAPPYKAALEGTIPSNLLRRNTQFQYFVKNGPGQKMNQVKREGIFIGLIESIHPKDAELVIAMINKQKPTGISRAVVEEAFPGLLLDSQS